MSLLLEKLAGLSRDILEISPNKGSCQKHPKAIGGRAEVPAGADPGARTPICVSSNFMNLFLFVGAIVLRFVLLLIYLFNPDRIQGLKKKNRYIF